MTKKGNGKRKDTHMENETKDNEQNDTETAKNEQNRTEIDNNEMEDINNQDCQKIVRNIESKIKDSQQLIINFIEMNTRVLNGRIDDVMKEVGIMKNSINFFQEEVFDKKIKEIHSTMEKLKKDVDKMYEEINSPNANITSTAANDQNIKEIKDKLIDIENRSRRNNIRVEGVKEGDKEDWETSKRKLKKLLNDNLGLDAENITIERAHRTGKKINGKERVIVAKLLNYEDKEEILKNSYKLKDTGIYINEDYSEETLRKRAELIPQMKKYREEGKYAIIQYDKLIVK